MLQRNAGLEIKKPLPDDGRGYCAFADGLSNPLSFLETHQVYWFRLIGAIVPI
jgi:hypothetical protein